MAFQERLDPRNKTQERAERRVLAKILDSELLSAEERRVVKRLRDRSARIPAKRPNEGLSGAETKQRIHLLLPAFNEEEGLPILLQRLVFLKARSRIVVWVVDDGSTDRTAQVAREGVAGLDIRLISHDRNLGLGQAVLTGIRAFLEDAQRRDILVVMDADDTHGTDLMENMVDSIGEGADIALASRFVPGGDDRTAPTFRRFLSRGASVLFRACLPVAGIRDFTSGYRAYRAELLRKAMEHWGERLIEERGFACMVELLLKLRYFEPSIRELPLVLRYDRKRGPSKLKLFRTVFQYVKLGIRDLLQPPPVRVGRNA